MDKRIYLIGFMGSGKSTVGKRLASKLGCDFSDLDNRIENKYRITIPTIFDRFDEQAFRILEQQTLHETFSMHSCVIATGGGTPCFFDNMDRMNEHGTTVYLKLHPHSLYQRLAASKKKRPLIDEKSPDEIEDFIRQKLSEREDYYNKAQQVVRGENLDLKALAQLLTDKSE